jgi:hypothetical protein
LQSFHPARSGKKGWQVQIRFRKTRAKTLAANPATLVLIQKSFASQFSITTFSISKSDASPCDAKLSITTFGISKSDASLCDANCTFLLQKNLLWKTKR